MAVLDFLKSCHSLQTCREAFEGAATHGIPEGADVLAEQLLETFWGRLKGRRHGGTVQSTRCYDDIPSVFR